MLSKTILLAEGLIDPSIEVWTTESRLLPYDSDSFMSIPIDLRALCQNAWPVSSKSFSSSPLNEDVSGVNIFVWVPYIAQCIRSLQF